MMEIVIDVTEFGVVRTLRVVGKYLHGDKGDGLYCPPDPPAFDIKHVYDEATGDEIEVIDQDDYCRFERAILNELSK